MDEIVFNENVHGYETKHENRLPHLGKKTVTKLLTVKRTENEWKNHATNERMN